MASARVLLEQPDNPALVSESMVPMNVWTGTPLLLLMGLIGVLGAPTVAGLVNVWSGRDDYSHGYLIPAISGYLIWNSRATLFSLPLRPARWLGTMVVAGSGVVLVVTQLGGMVTAGGVALVATLFGAVLLVAGREWAARLLVPIGYLLLAVPVLDSVIAPLHWPFQLLTAEMSTKALQALGVPALLEGNYITIPKVKMEVATQCSGASMLVAVVAIWAPLAYLHLRSWPARGGLLIFGIVVAIVANWARVTVIGLYAQMGGEEFHGPMHIFQGLSVAWIGFVALFTGAWALSRFEDRRGISKVLSKGAARWEDYRLSRAQWARAGQGGWIGVGMLAVLAGVLYGFTPVPTPLRQDLSAFPYEIGQWRGTSLGSEAALLRAEGADAELVREYSLPSGGPRIQLYVAYFAAQKQGKEIVNDRTAALHQQVMPVTLSDHDAIPVNSGEVTVKGDRRAVLFWYEDNGQINADRRRSKLAMVLNNLLYRKTNGTLVLLSVPALPIPQSSSEGAGLQQFAQEVHKELRKYLP